MKCPACFNELTARHAGSVEVDVCQGGCGGMWLDAFELQKVDKLDSAGPDDLLISKQDPAVVVDHGRKRECPRCPGIKLQRHYYSATRRVQVDACPNCGGYWLDAGELALVRAEKAAASPDLAGQKNLSMEVIRYLYQLKTEGRREP